MWVESWYPSRGQSLLLSSLCCFFSARCVLRAQKKNSAILSCAETKINFDWITMAPLLRWEHYQSVLCKKQNRFSVIYTREASLVFYLKQTPQILSVRSREGRDSVESYYVCATSVVFLHTPTWPIGFNFRNVGLCVSHSAKCILIVANG
jgi:hypothetical protein